MADTSMDGLIGAGILVAACALAAVSGIAEAPDFVVVDQPGAEGAENPGTQPAGGQPEGGAGTATSTQPGTEQPTPPAEQPKPPAGDDPFG